METYEYIINNRDNYCIGNNLFECPICKSQRTTKGFLQHVKKHFYCKDLTNFIQSSKTRGKLKHIDCLNNYNKDPNICLNCQKPIIAQEYDNIKTIKRKKFCSKSCAASYNNRNRTQSNETRKKISDKLRFSSTEENESKCLNCGCSFYKRKSKNKFCSEKCYIEYRCNILTKEELIKEILNFINNNQYIPSSKLNNNWSHFARKYFGTWNNMIKQLGYNPNNQKFGKKTLKCKDGHIADSISEKIVDDWLFDNNIKHDRRKKYPNSNRDCDFYLIDKNIWLEYFGLVGELDEYDKAIEEKEKLCLENNLKLIGIYPKDLYPDNKLSTILNF